MTSKKLDFDSASVHLTIIIRKINTYLDILDEISRNKNLSNNFWDLIISAIHDSIIVESYKLIDENNSSLSINYLIKLIKEEKSENIQIIADDHDKFKELVNNPEFLLRRHRSCQKAHHGIKSDSKLPRFVNFSDIVKLLKISEELITKYNQWIKGAKYSISFDSIYVPNHKTILEYISKLNKSGKYLLN